MRTELPEALLLFRKWEEEKALVYCEASFKVVAFCLEGTITSISDTTLELASSDGTSKLILALGRVVRFGFGDTRNAPDEAEDFDSGLVLFFGDPETSDHPESISIVERRP